MDIFNRRTSKSTGDLPLLKSWMLIGPHNSEATTLSLQISEIPVGSEQPLHHHDPDQCYYIIRGKGLMTIDSESCQVAAGDAVFIPSNKTHGIKNLGDGVLEYLTANSPAFSDDYAKDLWTAEPEASGSGLRAPASAGERGQRPT